MSIMIISRKMELLLNLRKHNQQEREMCDIELTCGQSRTTEETSLKISVALQRYLCNCHRVDLNEL